MHLADTCTLADLIAKLEDMRRVYGDHIKVVATASGIIAKVTWGGSYTSGSTEKVIRLES